ncbi:hypothetical protein D1007_44386 [Hordeum vulgare]|nr:hypothetical protein D1007_44386 [Hordeum vulgare]
MAGGSTSKKSSSQGAWLGSEIGEEHIEALRHHRLLSPASQVLVRLPSAETAPTPAVGEIVVFNEHFYRGFGLPASAFFSEWLRFFGLQPHHLNANPAQDALNMPPFNIDPPTRLNWAVKTPKPIPEVALICAHLEILEKSGLLGRDLLTTMVTRRILPL